jgi:hypothetical protein
MADSKYHTTKDGRRARKGLYYYMNRAKKRGTSKPGKGSVSDEALEQSAKTAKKGMGGMKNRKLMKKAGFPDLSGDGKVTKKDILMGRGVIGKKKKKQEGGMRKIAKAALDAAVTGVPGAVSKMVTGDTKAAVTSAAGPAVSAAKAAAKKAPKKKGMGGKKMSYMKKGGKKKQSKMMYEMGGFLSEPSVFDLDRD